MKIGIVSISLVSGQKSKVKFMSDVSTMLYYNQIVLIRLAHRLYTDFQYFFVLKINIGHLASKVYAHLVQASASQKEGKVSQKVEQF